MDILADQEYKGVLMPNKYEIKGMEKRYKVHNSVKVNNSYPWQRLNVVQSVLSVECGFSCEIRYETAS